MSQKCGSRVVDSLEQQDIGIRLICRNKSYRLIAAFVTTKDSQIDKAVNGFALLPISQGQTLVKHLLLLLIYIID